MTTTVEPGQVWKHRRTGKETTVVELVPFGGRLFVEHRGRALKRTEYGPFLSKYDLVRAA